MVDDYSEPGSASIHAPVDGLGPEAGASTFKCARSQVLHDHDHSESIEAIARSLRDVY